MAIYNFRILLETVEGVKSSYISVSGSNFSLPITTSFIDTSDNLVLSASQVETRINERMISCSYQNQSIFSGSDFNLGKIFNENLLLSASLTGSSDTGSIEFIATNTEYDRLLRYKFFGDKVCNVLGLPSEQWVYVDQVRFPADDERNIFKGNANFDNVFVSDTFTFASNANVNSDIPFLIDTGSDRYIKFIDSRGTGNEGLILGYDKDEDVYELNASENTIFNIKNFNLLSGSSNTSTGSFGKVLVTDLTAAGSITAQQFVTQQISVSTGNNIFGDSNDDIQQFTGSLDITGSGVHKIRTGNVAIGTDTAPKTLTVQGDISGSDELFLNLNGRVAFGPDAPSPKTFIRGVNDEDLSIAAKRSLLLEGGSGKIELFDNVGNALVTTRSFCGIGTREPTTKLDVRGPMLLSGSDGHITASGNISCSGVIQANTFSAFGASQLGGTNTFGAAVANSTHTFIGNITASGNISSSGDLSVNAITASGDIIANGNIIGDNSTNIINVKTILGVDADSNTGLTFNDDRITLAVGNESVINLIEDGVQDRVEIGDGGDVDLIVKGNGDDNLIHSVGSLDNVGIGTFAPAEKLSVEGNVSASGFITHGHITASGNISASGTIIASQFNDDGTNLNVPDYVFESEYKLKSLNEIENHISKSKHLPNVPSRDEIDKWGQLSMGDRDMLLLEKIEELTLHIINLQKQIDEMKKE